MAIENLIKGEPDWHQKINNNNVEISNKIGVLTTDLSEIAQEQTSQNNSISSLQGSVATNTNNISTNTNNISKNAIDINTQKSRIDLLVQTASTSFYEKCTSADTGALLVVSSGATTGQINLTSVTPVATGYTSVAGDYVRLVYGVASGSAELVDSRTDALGFTYNNSGEHVRNFEKALYNSGDLILSCGTWEIGLIGTTYGTNSDNTKFARTKDYISVPVGRTLKFNVSTVVNTSNTPYLTLYYYDSNKTFIKSKAVQNLEETIEYPNIRLCYFYQGATVDVSLQDAKLTKVTTKITFDGLFEKIPQLAGFFDKTPQMLGTVSPTSSSVDFNNLKNGYYFVSCSSAQASNYPLLNAPLGAKWGYYEVLAIPFTTNYSLQVVMSSNSAKRGIFIRTYNTSTNVTAIDWKSIDSDLARSRNEWFAAGDSITWGHLSGSGTTESPFVRADYPYPTTVANALGFNVTYGAQTGSGWLQVSGGKTAVSIVDGTDFSIYNLATLAFGTNDYANNQPLGTINDDYSTIQTVYSAIKHCVEKVYTSNPLITLILITPFNAKASGATGATMTSANNWRYGTQNTQGYTLSDVCQAIVNVANYYGIPYIDNREGSPITRLNMDSILIDTLHPTNIGYQIIGQYLAGRIGAIFQASKNY